MKKIAFLTTLLVVVLLTSRCTFFPWTPIGPTPEPEPQPWPVDSTIIESYSVSLGQKIVFEFESNATTGYQWQWDNSYAVSNVDSVEFSYITDTTYSNGEPIEANVCGTGGIEYWTFKGVKVGSDTLKFSYVQPWEVVIIGSQKRIVEITVIP